MPTREAYDRELAVVDAQHAYEQRLRAENEMFRILVRQLRGQFVGFRDRMRMAELAARFPHLADL